MRRAILWAAFLVGCRPADTEFATYVGRAVCAECHVREDRAYAGSDHDWAMTEVSDTTVFGDFDDAALTQGGVTSTFFRRDGGFWVRTPNAQGALEEFRVAYTFGVHPLQQYLVAFPDGRVQRLSISWDNRPANIGGQRWFDLHGDEPVPPDDLLHWTRVSARWNAMCADCHSTGVRRNYDTLTATYATRWEEMDVSCEACHAPGSRHVAWARAVARGQRDTDTSGGLGVKLTATGEWIMDSVVARLRSRGASRDDVDLGSSQIQVCARCHSYRTALSEDDTRIPFGDTHALSLLEEGLYFDDGHVREEVFVTGSFLQSRMHAAGVVCSDCHDPHSTKTEPAGDALCAQCHDRTRFATPRHHRHPPETAGARCVNCHMPVTTFMVIDDRRDHSFRSPRPAVSAAVRAPDPCTSCHQERSQAWAADQVAGWRGSRSEARPHFGLIISAARRGDPSVRPALLELTSDSVASDIVRATAITLLPRFFGRPELEAARRALEDRSALVRAAALRAYELFGTSDVAPLLPLLDDPVRSVRIVAARILAPDSGSVRPPSRARLETVLEEWRAAQTVNADLPQAQVNLGGLYADLGNVRAAEAAFRKAIAIEPRFAVPYVALGDLYTAHGRMDEAGDVLRHGLAAVPDDPSIRFTLGLHLARTGDRDGAVLHLAEAARLAPANPRFAWAYAIGLNDVGNSAQAVTVLRATLEQFPWDRRVMFTLATILRDWGELESARAYADRLVKDWPDVPQYQQLHLTLSPSSR